MKFSTFSLPVSPGAEHDHRIIKDVSDWAVRLDEAGFASFFLAEHHFSGYNTYGNSFLMAAHILGRTQQIHVGFAVAVVPLHHPARLAEMANLLDQLGDGRVILGLGSGGIPFESIGLGVPSDGRHSERMNDLIEIVQDLWAHTEEDEPYSFDAHGYSGTLYQRIMPSSYREGHPLLMRACQSSDDSVRDAARRGWSALLFPMFMPGDPYENLKRWWDIYQEELHNAGHDKETIASALEWTSAVAGTAVADSVEDAMEYSRLNGEGYMNFVQAQMALEMKYLGTNPVAERVGDHEAPADEPAQGGTEPGGFGGPIGGGPAAPRKGMLMGPPELVAQGVKEYEELGIPNLMLNMDMGLGTADQRQRVRHNADRFIEEVMPML